MRPLIIAVVLIFLSLFSFSQTHNSDTIHWTNNYHLQYNDFKGIPDSTSKDLANSYIKISYDYKVFNGKVAYTTSCYFLKNLSWTKYDMQALLDHEQTHFNISKLYSLKLFDTLQTYATASPDLENKLQKVYANIVLQMYREAANFDQLEKLNSMTDNPQKEYDENIKKQISILEKANAQQRHL